MRRNLRSTLIALAAASVLAFLEIVRTTLSRVLEGFPLTIEELHYRVIPSWITSVLASPWCAWMAERHPFRAGRIGPTLLAHLGGAAVFVAMHMAMNMTVHVVFGGARTFPFWPHLVHRYFFYVLMEMSLYGAIVLVVLLLDARREARERALVEEKLARNLASARLESLQAQIRPHFLFNTLNALAVLARRGDGAAVDRAIGDLGELLRTSFDTSNRREVALGEELGFLERYVSLQRIRFPDRLDVEWRIEEGARAARVPPLLVQPIVENALEHGLATARGGHVRVSARRVAEPVGDALELEVADDGPGFAAAGARETDGGVGLANIRERLRLLYGERGTLETGDAPEGGGRVRIRLPWSTAPEAGPA